MASKTRRSSQRTRRRSSPPSRPAPVRRPPAPDDGQWPSFLTPRLIGIGAAWLLVLLFRLGGTLKSGGSVVFWLAATAAAVYVGDCARRSADERDGWLTARRGALLGLFFLVPVAFNPKTQDVFGITKYTIVVIGGLVLAGLWVVEWVRRGRPPRWRNGLQWPVLALLGWTLVATMASVNPRVSLLGLYSSYDGLYAALAFGLLFFAVAEAFDLGTVRPALSALYFGAGGVVTLYGLLQLHDRTFASSGKWDWVDWGEASFKGSSIWSTLGNPNHLSGFLAVLLPIGLVLFFTTRSRWERVLISAISLGMVVEILQTATRGAIVAVAVLIPLVAVMLLPDIRARPRIAAAAVATLVVGVLGAGFVLRSDDVLRHKLSSMLDFTGTNTTAQRVELWKSAWEVGRDRPVVGSGPDTYEVMFPSYQTRRFVQLYGPDQLGNGAHNTFMNYLATEGFPGLTAFVAVLVFAGMRTVGAWRRLRRTERGTAGPEQARARELRFLLVGVTAAAVAYVVQASVNVQQVGLSAVFWPLLGLLTVIALGVGVPDTLRPGRLVAAETADATLERAGVEPEPVRRGGSNRARRARARRDPTGRVVVGGMITAAVVAVLSWMGSGPYRGDLHYLRALRRQGAMQQLASSGKPVSNQLLTDVNHEYDAAIKANPWEPAYIRRSGELAAAVARANGVQGTPQGLGFLQQARARYQRAVDLRPRDPFLRANLSDLLGQVRQATNDGGLVRDQERQLRRAYAINPWLAKVGNSLVAVLIAEGKEAEALRTAERGLSYSPRSDLLLRHAAQLTEKKGDKAKARRYWRRLLVVAPNDPEATKVLAAG